MGTDSMSPSSKPQLDILYEGFHYDVTDWVKRHPGGKIIEFFTANREDASIAINQFHHRTSDRVMAILKSLKKCPADEMETIGKIGSEVFAKHKEMTDDYMRLYKELLDDGLFKTSKMNNLLRITEIVLFVTVFFYLSTWSNPYVRVIMYLWAGITGARTAYLAHETGHRALTGNVTIDKCIESFAAGFINGMSSTYWNSQHNRHHAFPQRLKHDVDLETLPLIAFNKKVVRDRETANSFLIRNQVFLFHIFDTVLVGLAWKFYLHPKYALHRGAYLDLFFMTFHHIYLYILGVWEYLICLWLISFILFSNFALNHTHTAVSSESEAKHWVQYSFEHTVNIHHSLLVDWWMGQLNYQIEHHLFPQIPHFRLWRATDRVKAFAAKHDLPYRSIGYFEAFALTVSNLRKVSEEVKKID